MEENTLKLTKKTKESFSQESPIGSMQSSNEDRKKRSTKNQEQEHGQDQTQNQDQRQSQVQPQSQDQGHEEGQSQDKGHHDNKKLVFATNEPMDIDENEEELHDPEEGESHAQEQGHRLKATKRHTRASFRSELAKSTHLHSKPTKDRKIKHEGSTSSLVQIRSRSLLKKESTADLKQREKQLEDEARAAKARKSKLLAEAKQLFEVRVGKNESESSSWVDDIRGYCSDPCTTIPFDQKFTVKPEVRSMAGMERIKEKYMSMEDLQLDRTDYPELVTQPLSDTKLRDYIIDDSMLASWTDIFELEKQRFSFFDELFAQGFVVDSMEVSKSGRKEAEDKFVEAEEKDFRDKIDYGRVVFKTKHVYTGSFSDWYFQGSGKYVWLDGAVYEGEFSQGLMHGPGTIHWPDGSIYEGDFGNGTRAGWGVYSTSEGFTYAGDWLNGLPHGQGKMWYDPHNDEGDYYDGIWANGLQSGSGTRQYSNGDRYIGNWAEGERSGSGSMIWINDRQVYKGEWFNGVPQGKGKHIWYLERSRECVFPTRHIYTGDWHEGKRHGIGKMIYPCGSVYEGRWNNGQRHGKGVFINSAGGIMTGVFRAGAITGGSDVPLLTASYEYDFGGLVEWLTVKFNLNLQDELLEEESLADTTIRFLSPLRKLYHRTGLFGHMWGNNGLYPYWMKKSHPRHEHHIPNHNNLEEPVHMGAKTNKPPSPDGIHPVTRFGMWLLIKDCPGLTDDVTLAYFDRHFSNTPSLSFQTRHNPFEPISFWQFLQCLAIVAVTVNMEIPEQKNRWSSEDRDELSASSEDSVQNDPAVLTLKSPPEVNPLDRDKVSSPNKTPPDQRPPTTSSGENSEEGLSKEDPIGPNRQSQSQGTLDYPNGSPVDKEEPEIIQEEPKEIKNEEYIPFKQRPRVFNLSIAEAFEAFLIDKLVPCLDREAGVNLPKVPNPLPPIRDLYDTFKEIKDRDWITATEFMQNYLPHKVYPNQSDTIFWHRSPEILSPNLNLDDLFSSQRKLQSGNFDDENDDDDSVISLGPDLLGSVSDILISGNKPTLGKVQIKEDHQDDDWDLHVKRKSSVTDYVTDASPFCPEDLTSEPFLWQDEPTCQRVERKPKHYQNLTTHDVLNVLRFLYPKLVGHIVETNVDYNMIFCDWLWAVSLCAKVSADREFRSAILSEKDKDGVRGHHSHRPHTAPHGVFAHHVKRIKNMFLGSSDPKQKQPSEGQPNEPTVPTDTQGIENPVDPNPDLPPSTNSKNIRSENRKLSQSVK